MPFSDQITSIVKDIWTVAKVLHSKFQIKQILKRITLSMCILKCRYLLFLKITSLPLQIWVCNDLGVTGTFNTFENIIMEMLTNWLP